MLRNDRIPAVEALHDLRIFEPDVINYFSRWSGEKWLYPASHLVREDLRESLRAWIPDDEEYQRTFDAYEYRAALVIHTTPRLPGLYQAAGGEFVAEFRWNDGKPIAEHDFLAVVAQANDDWPWWPLLGGPEGYEQVLDSLREVLVKLQRW